MCNQEGPPSTDAANLGVAAFRLKLDAKLDEAAKALSLQLADLISDDGTEYLSGMLIVDADKRSGTVDIRTTATMPRNSINNYDKVIVEFLTVEPPTDT